VEGICYMLGGFRTLEERSHLRISSIRTEPFLGSIIWILLYKVVLHLNSMLGMSHPPSFLGRWRVVIGTLNVAPFHINQVQIVVSCRA